jgi:hypothetical protein
MLALRLAMLHVIKFAAVRHVADADQAYVLASTDSDSGHAVGSLTKAGPCCEVGGVYLLWSPLGVQLGSLRR